MYSDMMGIPAEDDDIYTDNVIDHNDIGNYSHCIIEMIVCRFFTRT